MEKKREDAVSGILLFNYKNFIQAMAFLLSGSGQGLPFCVVDKKEGNVYGFISIIFLQ